MIYCFSDDLIIRSMLINDSQQFITAFSLQGWEKSAEQFENYYIQQESGIVKIFVAEKAGEVAGYALLYLNTNVGPFKNTGVPEVSDFNVLQKFQRMGIGSQLLATIEQVCRPIGCISLAVGLHSGYGSAQRMYAKRGYIPDGSGVWYNDKPLPSYAECRNDDGLMLYMKKYLLA